MAEISVILPDGGEVIRIAPPDGAAEHLRQYATVAATDFDEEAP